MSNVNCRLAAVAAVGPVVIGLFVGIDMLFNGSSLVMLGLAAKMLPEPSPHQ